MFLNMEEQVGVLHNKNRKRMAVSLVTCPISRSSPCLLGGERVHHRYVERMRAKALTHVCKGHDCSIHPGSCSRSGLMGLGHAHRHYLALQVDLLGQNKYQTWPWSLQGCFFNVLSTERSVQSPKPCGRRNRTRNQKQILSQKGFYVIGKETSVTSRQDRKWSVTGTVR